MKIAWLHSHFQNWLGGTKYVFEVVKLLKKTENINDISVFVETSSKENRERFERVGVRVHALLNRSSYSPIYWLLLPFYLNKMRETLDAVYKIDSYDVIITSMFPMNWLVLPFRSPKKVQICYEPYAIFFDKNYRKKLPLLKRFFSKIIKLAYKKYDIAAVSQADEILTISRYNASWIKKVYGRDAKVVYEGVDTNFFRSTLNDKLIKRHKGKFIIFHSTDFTAVKNTEFLIKAMSSVIKHISNCKLLISETLDNKKARQKLVKLIKRENLENHVEFLGFLAIPDLPLYDSVADVVIQPSINQSMSLSIKEAMSCKAIVVRSNDVPQEDVIDGKNGFLVSPYNESGLVDIISKIGRMREEEKIRIKRNARWFIINNYTWKKVVQNLLKIIKN